MNIGIDLGGSHIGVGLVNQNGKIITKMEKDIDRKNLIEIEENIEKTIIEFIKKILKENDIDINKIQKIGIATPGEPKEGCIKNVVNLGITSFPIVQILKDKLEFNNIYIQNDGKCAAIAEKLFGSLKDVEDAVFLCIGTGIGGAGFMNGKLLKPKRHSGFEIGHMVIEKNGKECKCGNRGCFETYASMKNLKTNIAKELEIDSRDSIRLVEELRKNIIQDKVDNIIEEYLDDLVLGLINITNILEPQVITLGGGFVYYKEILWNKLNDKFKTSDLFFNKEDRPELKLATLGNDAGIIGASVI